MHSKVFSYWLPSYIKDTRPVLEIFKMAEYFADSPRIKSEMSHISTVIVILFPRPVYLANIGATHACHVFAWSL